MQALKIKKGPILLPLALLALVLVLYTVLHFQGNSAARSVELGRQYLNDLDYSSAVAAFTEAIALDPGDAEARVGLAQAYAGEGEYGFAQQVLEPVVYTERPEEDSVLQMIELLRQSGQLTKAVQLAQTLIDQTDDEAYYTLRSELMSELYSTARPVAQGFDQTLLVRDGQLYSKGDNVLGELGTLPQSTVTMQQFASAQFTGTPLRVHCAGRTSYVLDTSGTLWAAGENRWGQMSQGYSITAPRSGWQQVLTAGTVADMAGTTGRLLMLQTDGTLWTAGAGSDQHLTRLRRIPTAVRVGADDYRAVVLSTDGQLYESDAAEPDTWRTVASGVADFTITDDGLCWVGQDGSIHSDSYSFYVPDSWYDENGNVEPDRTVCTLASTGSLTLLVTPGGVLCRLPGDGTVQEIETASPVKSLYGEGDMLVLVYEDGSAQYWQDGAAAPQDIALL